MTKQANGVLLVEDEIDLRRLYASVLRKEHMRVREATTAAEARKAALGECPDVIILDILLPDGDGIAVLRGLREAGVSSRVVVLTASPILHVQRAVDLGIDAYINKAVCTPREMVAMIRGILSDGTKHATSAKRSTIKRDGTKRSTQ